MRPRWRGRALVALTMVIAGLLVSVTYDQAAAGAEGREQVREALISDIDRESSVSDDLQAQLEDLSDQVTSTRDELLAASAVGQDALDELARAEEGSAAVRVTGPGPAGHPRQRRPEGRRGPGRRDHRGGPPRPGARR